MGMYTELYLNVRLANDIPQHIMNMLLQLVRDGDDYTADGFDHPFFKTEGWKYLLKFSIFKNREPFTLKKDKNGIYLHGDCTIKNYNGIIEKFLKWILPYLYIYESTTFIGHIRYEDEADPELIYLVYDEGAEKQRYMLIEVEYAEPMI